jgi:molecular chaperone DnaK
VHVNAKDLGTGKEQSIKITASSGLNEAEIEKLVKEAEAHAEEDKRRKELIETRNHADAMVYSVEKNIKEFGDKVDAAEKAQIEEAITKTKKALEGDDIDAIKKAQDELMNVSHKLAEAMYAKTAGGQGGPGADGGAQQQGTEQQASSKKNDDVVDADFEDVK